MALMQGLGGLTVAAEMHGRIMQSGIYEASEKIYVSILGDIQQAQHLVDYVFSRHQKYVVAVVDPDLTLWEWPTLQAMRGYCEAHDCDVWYVHTKGASNCRPDVPPYIQKNIRDWRAVMSRDVLGRHAECKRLLSEGSDAVGPLLSTGMPSGPHFVGNFWWATSAHIRSLQLITPELSKDRNPAESWIGTRMGAVLTGMTLLTQYDCYDFEGRKYPQGVFHNDIGE